MVPANKLNWTVKRMPNPGPSCVAYSESTRCAEKNLIDFVGVKRTKVGICEGT
jgi:hypothetical protein